MRQQMKGALKHGHGIETYTCSFCGSLPCLYEVETKKQKVSPGTNCLATTRLYLNHCSFLFASFRPRDQCLGDPTNRKKQQGMTKRAWWICNLTSARFSHTEIQTTVSGCNFSPNIPNAHLQVVTVRLFCLQKIIN